MTSRGRSRPAGSRESVATTLRQMVRGVAGGLLLGLPPLFTMEMWYQGFLMQPRKILALVSFTFLIVIGYSAFCGFRRERSWPDLILDSVQTMGIAAIVAAFALWLLGRIDLEVGLRDAMGKIGLQMIPISLGVSLAGSQLADPHDNGEEAADLGTAFETPDVGALGRLFVAAGAALFLSLNVAPTEETIVIALAGGWWVMALLVAASLAVSYAIVFYVDFRGGRRPGPGDGPLDRPLTETVVAYAVSLLVSGLLVWSFGRTEATSTYAIVAQIVVLGVVAAIGGASGRLLLGGGADEDADATR